MLMKISIFVKIYEKSRFWATFSENVDFSQYQNFPQIWVLVKFLKNVDLGLNLQICRF